MQGKIIHSITINFLFHPTLRSSVPWETTQLVVAEEQILSTNSKHFYSPLLKQLIIGFTILSNELSSYTIIVLQIFTNTGISVQAKVSVGFKLNG